MFISMYYGHGYIKKQKVLAEYLTLLFEIQFICLCSFRKQLFCGEQPHEIKKTKFGILQYCLNFVDFFHLYADLLWDRPSHKKIFIVLSKTWIFCLGKRRSSQLKLHVYGVSFKQFNPVSTHSPIGVRELPMLLLNVKSAFFCFLQSEECVPCMHL